jgi:hypothetical protein
MKINMAKKPLALRQQLAILMVLKSETRVIDNFEMLGQVYPEQKKAWDTAIDMLKQGKPMQDALLSTRHFDVDVEAILRSSVDIDQAFLRAIEYLKVIV